MQTLWMAPPQARSDEAGAALRAEPAAAVTIGPMARPGTAAWAPPMLALDSDDLPAALRWCAGLADEGLLIEPAAGAAADAALLWLAEPLPLRLGWLRARLEAGSGVDLQPKVVVLPGLRELDAVLAFEMGADEVLDAARASPPLLAARLRALWRRRVLPAPRPPAEPVEVAVGGLRLVPAGREVLLERRRIEMTEGEFEVLWLLACHAGHAVPRSEILRRVRGLEDQPLDRSIDSRVYRIRHKLGAYGACIRTVRHVGYVLARPDGAAPARAADEH